MNVLKTVEFLKNLKLNNNKEWFELHRAEYNQLREEFYMLIEDIKFGSMTFDKTFEFYNPKRVAYRINRDVRFSKDKSPYKTEFGALFAANKQEKENGYHFHINAEGELFIGGGAYLPDKEGLKKIKNKIIEDPETFLEIIYNKEFNNLFGELSSEFKYKRIPSEYQDNFELIEYLKLKGFFAYRGYKIKEYINKDLTEFIVENFRAVHPLVQYIREIL